MRLAEKREGIFMQRWLAFHHYPSPQQSDFYYLKLCNEIYGLLRDDDFPPDELYGTYLPFFDLDPDEYFPDEINIEDVQFLLWYYISMVHDDTIINPG